MSQLCNRFPVIKPSVSASIRDTIGYLCESECVKRSKLVCSSLNIVKLMLEMTFSGPGKNCSGTDKSDKQV